MYERTKPLVICGVVLALALIGVNTALAQDETSSPCSNYSTEEIRYFNETGHNVCGPFLEFYQRYDGLELFGYPLTEPFTEDGRLVQYFERVRMEYHPENSEPYKVQLGLLGDLLGHRHPPIPESEIPNPNDPDSQYFPETGHTVKFAFLRYYKQKGGLDVFGYPISKWHYESGFIVQYFQRAKMEWHPESRDFKVQLGKLGEIWVNRPEFPRQYLEPAAPAIPSEPGAPPPSPQITEIRASASVGHAFTGRGGYQTVYVYVTDQQGKPVEGARVGMTIHYHYGDEVNPCQPLSTDDEGYTKCTFPLGNAQSGYIVVIDINVSHNGLSATTQTSFLPWW